MVRYSWQVAHRTPDALVARCATLMRADALPASRPVQTWPRLVGYELRGMTPTVGRWSGTALASSSSAAAQSRLR